MIYVAGKIRNTVNYDIPFLAAKKYLNKQGLNHITAVELLERINYTKLKENAIINEINNVIYNSESIYFLQNYIFSNGGLLEYHLAEYYNKNIVVLKWNDLFDLQFINDIQDFFGFDINSRTLKNKSYKQILIYILYEFIISHSKVGKIIYKTQSNTHSTAFNAIGNVACAFNGLNGIDLKNEYLYKYDLIQKFIRGYYEI